MYLLDRNGSNKPLKLYLVLARVEANDLTNPGTELLVHFGYLFTWENSTWFDDIVDQMETNTFSNI